jgi:7,8-dihydroneopterin aldolase/epimerase/oxygenase
VIQFEKMDRIILENIDLYAFHGHIPEEQKIGSNFRVNLSIEADIEKAGRSDQLKDTFDYRQAYQIIKEEMEIKSSLLEHVAERIVNRLFHASEKVKTVKIRISKLNPPFGGNVKAVAVELKRNRTE